MKKLATEFKEFAMGGNLVETGVALVMALALAAVINSLVENVLMPIVGIIFGEPSFDSLTWTVNGSVILYGSFITAFVSFLAIAFAVYFFIVKPYNAYKERVASGEEEEPAAPPEDIMLLREIRDSLAK
jgi:large conductance mechanosensitive channel